MKIIDLLNKIANGEITLGTKFNWHYKLYDIELIFTERHGALGLYFQREDRLIGLFERFNYQILNDEVEILEEEPKVQVELTEKEYLEYLDIINKNIKNIRDYIPKPSFLKLEEENKIPKKLKLYTLSDNDSADFTTLQDFNNRDIQRTINWILDYLKSKGE